MRNRVIFQSDALFVGPSPSTGIQFQAAALYQAGLGDPYGNMALQYSGVNAINQLFRVNSCNYSFQIPRKDVNQFGELAFIDRIIVEQPTVTLDFSYYLASFSNEKSFGFQVSETGQNFWVTAISGILTSTTDDKDYFVFEAPEGNDVDNNPAASGTLGSIPVSNPKTYGFGNGYISSYQVEAAVGNLPSASVKVEALNMAIHLGVTGNAVPAVSPLDGTSITGWFYELPVAQTSPSGGVGALGITALRPGDITLNVYNSGTLTNYSQVGATPSTVSGAPQTFRISMDLRRENLLKLGSRFAYDKAIQFPVTVSCSIDGLVTDLNTGALNNIICNDQPYDIVLGIAQPGCGSAASRPTVINYFLRGLTLDSQTYSLGLNDNKKFTLNFSTQIGSPTQLYRGLYLSGVTY